MQPTPDGLRIAEPKTKSSKRNVQLPPLAVDALRAHRALQNEERLKLGTWSALDLVFANRLGELRQYLRIPSPRGQQVSSSERRRVFGSRWQALMTELAAA